MDPFNFNFTPFFPPTSAPFPVYPTSIRNNNPVYDVGLSILSSSPNLERLEARQPLLSLPKRPPISDSLSAISKSLQLEKTTQAQAINDFSTVKERQDTPKKSSNKRARIAVLNSQKDPLLLSDEKVATIQNFFVRIVPNLESILSLKKQKSSIKSASMLGEDNSSRYEKLKGQIDKEEEDLVALILKNFFNNEKHVYRLGGMRMFHALGIMNLKTIRFLRVWNAIPAHTRIYVLSSTHSDLSLYFKDEKKQSQYQEYWVSLSHESRQNFVSEVERLNGNWKAGIKLQGLKKNHRTEKFINSYLMSKLNEVKNDEEGLKNFFDKDLELQRTNAQDFSNLPLQVEERQKIEEHYDNQKVEESDRKEKRSHKKAKIAISDSQEVLSSPSHRTERRGAKDFFVTMVPRLESIVSLKKQKSAIKSSSMSGEDESRCEQLKKQINDEEEKLVASMLRNLFYKGNQPYLLAGMQIFQALGIVNLKTQRLLKVWNALPPHNRVDILRSIHPDLSVYFKSVKKRGQYQTYWISLDHRERQRFVSDVKRLSEKWKTNIKLSGLKESHRTKNFINSYLLSKLEEVENDEEGLKNFFNKKLALPE